MAIGRYGKPGQYVMTPVVAIVSVQYSKRDSKSATGAGWRHDA